MLVRTLIWFTWIWVVVFVPIETYITWSIAHTLLLSGYAVNVLGVGIWTEPPCHYFIESQACTAAR
jgi:hypothetical protein